MIEQGSFGINPENHEGLKAEKKIITPNSLLEDNHSTKAQRRRDRFNEDRESGNQILIFRCSDSRYILTYRHTTTVSSIATGGPKELFGRIIEKDNVPGIIALPHENCGGLGARSVLEEFGFPENPDEIQSYLKDHLSDSDPLAVSANNARNISKIVPNKPVLAAVHRHESGDIFPLAVYRNGKPSFNPQVPIEFADFFRAQHGYVNHLRSEFPDLEQRQKNQNSKFAFCSDATAPAEVILPEHTRIPGDVFRVMSSRPKEGAYAGIDDENTRLVVAQMKYPIEHFSALDRILFATKDKTISNEMITELLKRPWARVWASKPDTQIYLANINEGVLSNIEAYPFEKV